MMAPGSTNQCFSRTKREGGEPKFSPLCWVAYGSGFSCEKVLRGQLPAVSTRLAGCVNLEVPCLVHRILRFPE